MKAQCAHWWDPRTWIAFAFWELRTIFAAIRDDGLSEWKATVVIVVAEIFTIVGLTNAVAVYLGRRLIYGSSPYILVVGVVVGLANLKAVFGKNKRWNRLSAEFENYSKPVRIGGGWAVVLLIILAIVVSGLFAEAQLHLPR